MDQKIIIMVVFVIICCCCFCCLSLSATSTAIVMAGGDTCEDYCDKDGTDTCEEDSDEEDDDDKYTCTCKAGYGGNKCETLICDTAAKADCNETGTTKQGTCKVSAPNAETPYTCECEPGYSGEKCDTTLALKTDATCANKCANVSVCVGNEAAMQSTDCQTVVGQCRGPDGAEVPTLLDSESCESDKHTWTPSGECSDAQHTTEAACTAVSGNTWTTGVCSDGHSTTEAACTGGAHTWTAGTCSDGASADESACTSAGASWTAGACSDGATTDPDECVLVPHTWTTGTCTDGETTDPDACAASSVNTWTDQVTWSPAGYCRGSGGTRTSDVNKQTCLNLTPPGSWIPDDKTQSKTGLTGYCSGSTCTIDDCCESAASTR